MDFLSNFAQSCPITEKNPMNLSSYYNPRGSSVQHTVPLFEKAISMEGLHQGFLRVSANKGCAGGDGVTISMFAIGLDMRLRALRAQLLDGRYVPGPTATFEIAKKNGGGKRVLRVPCIRDRVAQSAAALAIADVMEREFEEVSHAYRPGRGVHTALAAVGRHLEQGFRWVVDVDIRAYFDNVPHLNMLAAFSDVVPERPFINLIGKWLAQSAFEGRGLPQGAPISPVLANLYLDRVDEWLDEAGLRLVRYADDFVILCRSEARARATMEKAAEFLSRLGLELHPEKTVIRSIDEGFDYLGKRIDSSTLSKQLAELDAETEAAIEGLVETGFEGDPLSGSLGTAISRPSARKAASAGNAHSLKRTADEPWKNETGPNVPDQNEDDGELATPVAAEGTISRHAPFIRPLYLTEKGRRIDCWQSALAVFEGSTVLATIMAGMIDRIDIYPGTEISSDALRLAAKTGVPVFLVDGHGRHVAAMLPETELRSGLHLAQARISLDPSGSGLALARKFVAGRIWNERRLLQRLAGRRAGKSSETDGHLEAVIRRLDQLRRKAELDPSIQDLDSLRGTEARAARLYWPALSGLLQRGFAEKRFRRSRRPPLSPFNAVLNWTTHLLQRDLDVLCIRRGLHPGFGILHSVEDRKSSCVFDLIEEFRAPIAEALAAQMLSTGALGQQHFEWISVDGVDAVWLVNGGGTKVMRAYEALVDRRIKNPSNGSSTTWRGMMDFQLSMLINHLLDGTPYVSYKMDF